MVHMDGNGRYGIASYQLVMWMVMVAMEFHNTNLTIVSPPNTGFVIIYIRYRHIESHYVCTTNQVIRVKVHVLNILSFVSGFVSVVGLLITGTFQVRTHNITLYGWSHNNNYNTL